MKIRTGQTWTNRWKTVRAPFALFGLATLLGGCATAGGGAGAGGGTTDQPQTGDTTGGTP